MENKVIQNLLFILLVNTSPTVLKWKIHTAKWSGGNSIKVGFRVTPAHQLKSKK